MGDNFDRLEIAAKGTQAQLADNDSLTKGHLYYGRTAVIAFITKRAVGQSAAIRMNLMELAFFQKKTEILITRISRQA